MLSCAPATVVAAPWQRWQTTRAGQHSELQRVAHPTSGSGGRSGESLSETYDTMDLLPADPAVLEAVLAGSIPLV